MTRRAWIAMLPAAAAAFAGERFLSPRELRDALEQYLIRAAAALTDESLRDVTDRASWDRTRPAVRRQVLSMLGLDPMPPRTPLRAQTTGVVERPGYRIEKVVFESMPGLFCTANLYLPPSKEPLPTVLYVCGHSPAPAGAKFGYQHHGVWFARHGFAALLIDTIEFGEVPGIHHGIYNLEMWHWLALGYTPAGPEVWNGIRAIDYLATRSEIDIGRLGVTGISGGGIISWYLPAVDERVRAAASVCGTWTAATQLARNAVRENCDCVYLPNRFRLDLPAVGALIAPRPFKILGAQRDEMFPPDGYRDAHRRLSRIYDLYGASDRIALYEHDAPHKDIPAFRKEADEWLNRWLRDDRTVFDEGAIDHEAPGVLRVLDGLPRGAINDSIDRRFIAVHTPSAPANLTEWKQRREQLHKMLRRETFAAFPSAAPPPEVLREPSTEWPNRYAEAFRIEFTSEPGLRLAAQLYLPKPRTKSALLWLESDDDLIDPVNHDRILPALGRCATLVFAPRAVGCGLDRARLTTIRRSAAILGATLESMQVWDTLRAVDLLAAEGPFSSVTLFARRAMCVPALYAAAFDERITRVVLEDPPSSHWNGPPMLYALRTTDIPEVAAMLAPRPLVFLAPPPSAYGLTRSVYRLHARESAFRTAAGFADALELA